MMNIVVCVKRVPDLSEADVELDASGTGLRTEHLTFGLNDWDRFAIEEAIRLREEHGGTVTALTMGDEDAEEVLRRALAMGADDALRISDPSLFGADAYATARALRGAIAALDYDLVLTGSVSSDGGSGAVGGMLAELLGIPQVALATKLDVKDGTARIHHEVEGGMERVVEVDLPALVTVQTGINEPRYVSIRGIRKVSGIEIPTRSAADIGLGAGEVGTRWVTLKELFRPPAGDTAEILDGSPEEMADQLIELLKQNGGL